MTKYIICALLAITLGSCTRNNGDIGDLFGTWRLIELKADGEAQPLYNDETLLYTWAFQSEVIYIQTIRPHDEYNRAKGTWSRTGSVLALNFTHSDSDGPVYYTPPAALHLQPHAVTPLNIITLNHKEMRLYYTDTEGVKYEYYLKKAY